MSVSELNPILSERYLQPFSSLGLGVASVVPLKKGGNNAIYRVITEQGESYALKLYSKKDHFDSERLEREYTFLKYLYDQNIRSVPRPIFRDKQNNSAIYEWVDGSSVDKIQKQHVVQVLQYLKDLKRSSKCESSQRIILAKDACLSLSKLFDLIEKRFTRLEAIESEYSEVKSFVKNDCYQYYLKLKAKAERVYSGNHLDPSANIETQYRTLSPSDYGFHNILVDDTGKLIFLDFEYAGWDDPVKMVSDFLWHPGHVLSEIVKDHFREQVETFFCNDPFFATRLSVMYPLYGIVWTLILLNNFIPEIWQAKINLNIVTDKLKNEQLKAQMIKAQNFFDIITSL